MEHYLDPLRIHASPGPQLVFFDLPGFVGRNPDTVARLEAAVDAWDKARSDYYKAGHTPDTHKAKSSTEEQVAAILGIHLLCGLSPAHIREAIRRFREEQAAAPQPPAHLNEMTPAERQSAGIGLIIARQIVDREFHQRNDARDAGEQAAILSVVAKIAKALDDEIAKANERST